MHQYWNGLIQLTEFLPRFNTNQTHRDKSVRGEVEEDGGHGLHHCSVFLVANKVKEFNFDSMILKTQKQYL